MKIIFHNPRLLASALALTLGLDIPSAAYGLREVTPHESPVEQKIRAGLEETSIQPIQAIAVKLGLKQDDGELELRSRYVAKINAVKLLNRRPTDPEGKLVIVTGITPTDAGEGKTTTSIGLLDGLTVHGVRAIAALREPSLGPTLGAKGGATGTGRAEIFPADKVNLLFTGDFAAVEKAHNYLVEAVYNKIYHGEWPSTFAMALNYAMDLNARALRRITVRVGKGGDEQDQAFILTAASEVMAILALARDEQDLRRRLERIIVAWKPDGTPVTAHDVGSEVVDNMIVLLREALEPNLLQSSEGNPVLVHAGPFANIAHGTSSLLATRLALKLVGADGVVVQETGFGSDLGFEKFADVVAGQTGLKPDAVALVASIRALKRHGGVPSGRLTYPDVEAVVRGLPNLDEHLRIIQTFGAPVIVAVNRFSTDSEEEIAAVVRHVQQLGQRTPKPSHPVRVAVSTAVAEGGRGAAALATEVMAALREPSSAFTPLYQTSDPIEQKIRALAKLYGAADVVYTETARQQLDRLINHPEFHQLPLIMVKTPLSLSDDAARVGAPAGWSLHVDHLEVAAGAGFLRVYVGEKPPLLMPGLPKFPRSLLPDSPAAGLEERVTQRLRALAEGQTGQGLVVVPSAVLDQAVGLEELLLHLPKPLGSSLILWDRSPGLDPRIEAIHRGNPALPMVRGSVERLADSATSRRGLARVGVLSDDPATLTALRRVLPIPVGAMPLWDLTRFFEGLGVPQAVSGQVGLEELVGELYALSRA